MSTAQTAKAVVLNSWKEIAAYLGRGVRTVQRYERDLGLPVRRPRGKSRSAVIAMTDELDAWLRSAPRTELDKPEPALDGFHVIPLEPRIGSAVSESAMLRLRCSQLREENLAVLTGLRKNLEAAMQYIQQGAEIRAVRGGELFRNSCK